MFSTDPKDLAKTLSEMDRMARLKCNSNQVEAKEKLKEFVRTDRRFDQFDADALATRVMQCRSNGAHLDFDDPRLRGQEARPLERDYW